MSRSGFKHSGETRKKMSLAHIGLNTWAKNHPWSEARREAQKLVTQRKLQNKTKQKYHYSSNWYKIRKQIYERDNYTCQECNKKYFNLLDNIITRLTCHHIDYNKQNNNKNNLITLCAKCHTTTNFNREYWIKYFQNKIEWKFMLRSQI